MGYDIGPKIGIEGEKEFKNALKQINNNLKTLGTEMKAVTSAYDRNDKSSENLTSQNQVLNKRIDEQRAKVEMLKAKLAESAEKYGETDEKTVKWQRDLNLATADLNKSERKLRNNNEALAEAARESDQAGDKVEGAGKKAKKSGDDAEKGSDGWEDLKSGFAKVGEVAAKAAAAVATAAAGVATAFLATAESTRDLRTNTSKLETAFTTSGKTAKQAEQTYSELFRVLGEDDKSVEAANHLAKLANTQEELSDWTNITTGVFATFGDSLPIEGLTEAANETAKVGQVTGPLADALNWAGVSEDEFNKSLAACATEQERALLITETLNELYDDAADKYKEMNADVIAANDAQLKLNDTMAELGAVAEPIATSLKNMGTEILEAITPFVQEIAEKLTPLMEESGGVAERLGEVIGSALTGVVDLITWIVDNYETVLAVIVGIGAGMLAWNVVTTIQSVIGAIKAWKVATEGMAASQKILNLVMAANPVGIIITVIAALVAAIITLWNTNDKFREALSGFFNDVGQWFSDLWNTISEWFTNTINSITTWLSNLGSSVTGWFSNLWGSISGWLSTTLSNIGTWFSNLWGSMTGWLNNLWSNVSGWFSGLWSSLVGIGENIVNGIWKGLKNAWSSLVSWFTNAWDNLVGGVKDLLGIHSPSRVFADIGKNMAAGAGIGFTKEMKKVSRQINDSIPTDIDFSNRNGSYETTSSSTADKITQNPITQNVVINSPTPLTPSQVARESKNALRRLAWAK